MSLFVLHKNDFSDHAEYSVVKNSIPHGADIASIPAGSVVFPRFRSIPYGEALEAEVAAAGSWLVNSWDETRYISDVHSWFPDVEDFTPAVFTETDIPDLPEGEYFVKGETNSVKHDWFGSCFAPDVESVHRIVARLHEHSVVGSQKLVIRPFVRYRQLGVMGTGQPVFNEWRVFVYRGTVVGSGFYWMSHLDGLSEVPAVNAQFQKTVDAVVARLAGKADFFVVDFAQKQDGSWDVIEVNDANMSGLCGVDPASMWNAIAGM